MFRIHRLASSGAHRVSRTLAALSLASGAALSVPHSAAAQAAPGADRSSSAPCTALDAVPPSVIYAPFLVFGEVHGTREVPAFVTAYLCAAAKAQRRITLALEYPASEQHALDAFMASGSKAQDAARLAGTAFWSRDRQDGRTSAAMLRMIDSIRTLRASGADIKVVAIDGDGAPAGRDALMAGKLRTELDNGADRQLLVLIGGLHAVRTKGNRFNPHYESAVYLLADKRPLALTVGTSGGTAWVCRGPTPASCAATNWDINRVAPAPGTAFSLVPPSAQFDGVFFVGATTASPPVQEQEQEQEQEQLSR
jgi:hypothetical protein